MARPLLHNVLCATHNVKTENKVAVRCALSVAPSKIFATILFLVFFCSFPLHAAEPVMKTLSAHVIKVAEDGLSVDVDFRNPATEEVQPLTFHVDDQTGLSGFAELPELRAGQVVNIDYVEGEKHRFLIRRIARVKLSGPPAGLEKFRGL